jgi:exosortase D (VPLPA-CTERM-specific)
MEAFVVMTPGEGNSASLQARTPSPRLLGAAAGALLVVVLFSDAIANLWSRWGQQQELSHSYMIPLVSLWLIYSSWDRVKASVGAPSLVGVGILGVAFASFLLGRVTSIYLFQHIGLVIAIAGLVASAGGVSLLRVAAAPIGFLFFAVPPPYWVITVLSWKFQAMSSFLGVKMIEAMNIPVYLSGNIIDLGDYQLQVAEACSGLRYLFPFLSLGVIAAYMYNGALWRKAVIVLSTIPITILMNSVRIAFTGYMVQAYGSEQAEGALHFFEGWVVFLLCLAALFGIVMLLGRFSKPRVSPLEALATPDLPSFAPSTSRAKPSHVLGAVVAATIATFALAQAVTVKSLIKPDREYFAAVPDEFAGWGASVRPMDPSVAETLGADDTIVVDLSAPDGEVYNLYMAYLDAQRDGRSWHSPRQCIPGGGWEITRHTIERATTPRGAPIAYNRMLIENGDARQLVYYWYDQRGRKMANEFVMKFWLIIDAITRKRSDGAMIRLITPLETGDTLEEADARLKGMIERVDAFIPAYVPE